MLTYRAASSASPETVWALLARPERWSEWAPHVRGAWRLGSPEVEPGSRGAARLLGAIPVPARITDKRAGRSWTWRVGPLEMVHRVERSPVGCVVAVDLRGPRALEPLLRVTYGPAVAALVRNLARVAAVEETVGRAGR